MRLPSLLLTSGLSLSACSHPSLLAELTGSTRGPRVLSGESKVSWSVEEGGVSWTELSIYAVQTQLRVASDDTCTLVVVGTLDVSSSFYRDEDPRETEARYEVDDAWRCALIEDEADGFAFVVLDDESEVQRYRCRSRQYPDKPAPALVCVPELSHDGWAWKDPLPGYLRLPLVLTHSGQIHAEVWGQQERATTVEDIDVW